MVFVGDVSFNVQTPIGSNVPFGPCGKLDNAGEEIELQIPGDLEYGLDKDGNPKKRYWIPIDKIKYEPVAPWPTSADGAGDSLHRNDFDTYGRDHSNWIAVTPTPGQ